MPRPPGGVSGRRKNENGTAPAITALLEARADPKAKDYDGTRPWDYARDNQAIKKNTFVYLLFVNKHPLHSAAENNENLAFSEALLIAGADPNANMKDGNLGTPLDKAATVGIGNPSVSDALLAAEKPLISHEQGNRNTPQSHLLYQADSIAQPSSTWRRIFISDLNVFGLTMILIQSLFPDQVQIRTPPHISTRYVTTKNLTHTPC